MLEEQLGYGIFAIPSTSPHHRKRSTQSLGPLDPFAPAPSTLAALAHPIDIDSSAFSAMHDKLKQFFEVLSPPLPLFWAQEKG